MPCQQAHNVTLKYDVLCVLRLYDPRNKFLQRPINLPYGSVPLAFFSVADTFPMEIDKHQAMFRRYNRTFRE